MGKVLSADKMGIQMLSEQGYGVKGGKGCVPTEHGSSVR